MTTQVPNGPTGPSTPHPKRAPVGSPLFSAVAIALLALGACKAEEPGYTGDPCAGDRCDTAESLEQLLEELEGHQDPIADFLRKSATERGTLEGDYHEVLDGVGAEIGCDESTEASFMVLSNHGFVPKAVFSRCADDPQMASRFFAAVPALMEDDSGHRDMDPQILHLSAWDEEASRYRIYSTRPTGDGDMGVGVSPSFCLGCHGGPQQLDYWQPLMNEMTNPWSGWNAEPGFSSQLFDEFLDDEIAGGDTYKQLTAEGLLESASELEPIVRAGLARVNGARMLERNKSVNVRESLALVQPLFCDEMVNFVSEIHGSGEIRATAVVDEATVSHFRALEIPETWSWMDETDLRIGESPSMWESITLVPVRGESTLLAEVGLVARGAIPPQQALRIRALDWYRPTLSELRCGLYRSGSERILAGALDEEIAGLGAFATNETLLPVLIDEILKFDNGTELVSLSPPEGADVLAIADGNDSNNLSAIANGDTEAFALTLAQWGGQLEDYFDSMDRLTLRVIREQRACRALYEFANAPIFADLDCQ